MIASTVRSSKDETTRHLENMERMFSVFHKRTGDLVTVCAVELKTEHSVTIKEFAEKAVRCVNDIVDNRSILRSCIADDRLEPLFSREEWPRLKLLLESNMAWNEIYEREYEYPFPEGTALARFMLHVDPFEGNKHLICSFHHALFDGRSMQILVKDFIHRMVGCDHGEPHAVKYAQPSTSISDLLRSDIRSSLKKTTHDRPFHNEGIEDTRDEDLDRPSEMFKFDNLSVRFSECRTFLLHHHLSENQVVKLRGRCRSLGVKLTSAILAANKRCLLSVANDNRKWDDMKLQCCVDLRRYMAPEACDYIGNLFGMVFLPSLPIEEKDGEIGPEKAKGLVREDCKYIQSHLDSALNDCQFLNTMLDNTDALIDSANKLCDKVLTKNYHGRDFGVGNVSNLGVLDINTTTDIDTEPICSVSKFWYATRLAHVGPFTQVSCASIPGSGMCITFNYAHPVCSHETAKRLFEVMIDALLNI